MIVVILVDLRKVALQNYLVFNQDRLSKKTACCRFFAQLCQLVQVFPVKQSAIENSFCDSISVNDKTKTICTEFRK